MKIDYKYKEAELPIKKAEWKSTGGANCSLHANNIREVILKTNHATATYNLPDFREYVELMNRVLKQMEGGAK